MVTRTARRRSATAAALLAAVVAVGCGHDRSSAEPTHATHAVGAVAFPISCSDAAQEEFNRAVALLHHMTYPQAREAFARVADVDPACAMAYWGIAMTLFQPLWPTRPSPADVRRGWESVLKAESLRAATQRERQYIGAAKAFFAEPDGHDYWLRIRRWEQAMADLYSANPDDPEAAAFFALAHLAVAPPDVVSRAHADRAAGLLVTVFEANPSHPGAMHYLTHANDVPGREHELLDVIRKYETVAPQNPHALHMPTHIHTRLGDWGAVIEGNLKASAAALEYPAGDQGQFVWDEFPHAIEYLVYAHLQRGADTDARAQLDRLLDTKRLQPSFKTVFHLVSTRARFALERRAWGEAARLSAGTEAALDPSRFFWPEGVLWFARGLGSVHEGDLTVANRARVRLSELEKAAAEAGEDLFARNIRVLRLGVEAWIADAGGKAGAGVDLLREAAELETSTPKHAVTPAPTLPAYEMLGDLLMKQRRPTEALDAYRRSLEQAPRRFNSLLGAARAARAANDGSAARGYYRDLLAQAPAAERPGVVAEANEYAAAAR